MIVFAREPIAGEVKTRLIPDLGAQGAAELADAFILDAIRKARALAGSLLVIAGTSPGAIRASRYFVNLARRCGAELIDQGDGSLGARMARVVGRYSKPPGAILIGTDTPSLPQSMLRQNLALLRESPLVLAPSLDGGYYLVGISGEVPDIFAGIDWGSSRVLQQTIRRARRLGIQYRLGPWWYDVDRGSDLRLLAADLDRGLLACGSRTRAQSCPATARLLRRLGLLKLNDPGARHDRAYPLYPRRL